MKLYEEWVKHKRKKSHPQTWELGGYTYKIGDIYSIDNGSILGELIFLASAYNVKVEGYVVDTQHPIRFVTDLFKLTPATEDEIIKFKKMKSFGKFGL